MPPLTNDEQPTIQLDHLITKKIRTMYFKRLTPPIIFIIVVVLLWYLIPIHGLFFPQTVDTKTSLKILSEQGESSIKMTFPTLYFTGYTSTVAGQTSGYYYYSLWHDQFVVVQLTPKTCEQGLPSIQGCEVTGYLQKENDSYQQLITNLSADLKWTDEGMKAKFGQYYISEPSYVSWPAITFRIFFLASLIFSSIYLLLNLLYGCFPIFSPSCRKLGRFGKANELLAQAEEELSTLPQLATEDMFITETFFIVLAPNGIAVIPIKDILWVYKYSTLHNFLWFHFEISYTLHITATNHFYIQCPKNIKSDIDGIMDYLTEANHEILAGFNEENRKKIQEIQNRSLLFQRLIEFLKRRI